MNRPTLEVTIGALRKQLHEYEAIVPGCVSCEHFAHKQCEKHKAAPPADWIGGPNPCPDWEWDGIPF